MKHFFILTLFFSLTALAEARHPVIQESATEAESFRFESAQTEKEASREVAGEGFSRRQRGQRNIAAPAPVSEERSDSEVQYWQYSE